MQKIPTLFKRDPDDMARVLPEVHPACQWVLDGEGVATWKYDGTCVMFDGDRWWARREVKAGKQPPAGYRIVENDPRTGKTVGWEPIEQSAFAKFHAEAVALANEVTGISGWPAGTYELVGPKINGNPEKAQAHALWAHETADVLDAPRSFDALRTWLASFEGEGIVWRWPQPDGSVTMAKLKGRDFPKAGA